MRPAFVFWLAFCGVVAAEPEYFAVCDAGSTGTRLYIFELDVETAQARSIFVKKTKPGLSSYAEDPSKAVGPLLQLLREGSEKVPKELRATTPLSIFGTAGLRLLELPVQSAIWETVRQGLTSASDFPFDVANFQGRTVSGREEGLWAMYNANFLTGRMSHDLLSTGKSKLKRKNGEAKKSKPLGLMDLGGSSTQIAIPSAAVKASGWPLHEGATVHSYLGFGMTYIREQMRKSFQNAEDSVCYMKGTPIDETVVGKGLGSECRAIISDKLQEQMRDCATSTEAAKPCLGALAADADATTAIKKGEMEFYAVAGMTYVADFMRWYLEEHEQHQSSSANGHFITVFPRPSLGQMKAAVDVVCAGDYAWVKERTAGPKERQHSFTGFDNLPYRCFQANYIIVLLADVYGFSEGTATVSFLLDIDGEDLEWPLGALLEQRAQQAPKKNDGLQASGYPELADSHGDSELADSHGDSELADSHGDSDQRAQQAPKKKDGLRAPKKNGGLQDPKKNEGLQDPKKSEVHDGEF